MTAMLERQYGPREILPGSLWPGLTVGGAAVRSWQQSEVRACDDNRLVTPDGLWLPSLSSSEADFEALDRKATIQSQYGSTRSLAGIAINETGC